MKKETVVNQKKEAEPKAKSTGSKISGRLLVDFKLLKFQYYYELKFIRKIFVHIKKIVSSLFLFKSLSYRIFIFKNCF